jgi:hypothetical protein
MPRDAGGCDSECDADIDGQGQEYHAVADC